LYPGQPHRMTTSQIEALPSRKSIALIVIGLVVSLGVFVLSSREAQAKQESMALLQPTVTTGSVAPPLASKGEPPPLQVPVPETDLPKTMPTPVSTTPVAVPQQPSTLPSVAYASPPVTPLGGTPLPVTMPAGTPPLEIAPPEAPPAVAVRGDAVSLVDRPDRSPVTTDKPRTPTTAGGSAEKENDSLSSPPLKQGKPSVLSPATSFDDSEAQAQRLPRAQAALESAPAHSKPADSARGSLPAAPLAALEPPSTDTLSTDTLMATPLPHRASSPAANNSAAVPIDHPAVSPASASTQWEIAPVAEGLARYMSPPWPSSSIGTARDSVVQLVQSSAAHAQQEARVSDLASFQASSSAWREISSEGTPAPPAPQRSFPSSPSPEPSDYYSFALSGGSELSTSVGPLLLGILALGGWFLLRPAFRTYLAWCKIPKPSSALLMPLERPG
jgi:hypothetical protein